MVHSLKGFVLFFMVLLASSCCLFSLPSLQALEKTPTVEIRLETSSPRQNSRPAHALRHACPARPHGTRLPPRG